VYVGRIYLECKIKLRKTLHIFMRTVPIIQERVSLMRKRMRTRLVLSLAQPSSPPSASTEGRGFFTLGCICTLYLKCIFVIFVSKNLKQKCFVYMSMFYVPTKLFQQKITFYMVYVKMTKFGIKIGNFTMHVFIFFA
jgi:hypothetical protein